MTTESLSLTDLPPIPGAYATQANALNNSAYIVGYSVSNGSAHATLWRDGSAVDIGGADTFANGINDSDQIVGYRQVLRLSRTRTCGRMMST